MIGFNPLYAAVLALLGPQPALSLDFVNNGYLPSIVNFSRASNATQFDAAGNLVWAPHNLIPGSESFTGGTPIWTLTSGGTGVAPINSGVFSDVPGGGPFIQAVRFVLNKGNGTTTTDLAEVFNTAPPTSGALAARSVWAKSADGSTYTVILGGGAPVAVGPSWQEYKIPTGSTERFRIMLRGAQTPVCSEFADILVTGAKVWLVGSEPAYALTTSSPYYGPRFDYDPATGTPWGLRIEEARTNLNPTSINAGTTGATQQAGSLASYTLRSQPMVEYTGDGTTTGHFFHGGSVTPAASTVYYLSAHVGPSSNNLVQLTVSFNYPVDTANTYINFNTSTGAVVSIGSAVSNVSVKNLGGGNYRIGFAFTTLSSPAAGAGGLLVAIDSAAALRLPSIASTATIRGGGFQLEVGTFPTTYIPTFGTAATRAADDVTASVSGAAQYTLFAQSTSDNTTTSGSRVICSFYEDAYNYARVLQANGGTTTSSQASLGGIAVTNSGGAISSGVPFKSACSFRGTEMVLAKNGAIMDTDAGTIYGTSSRTVLQIGRQTSGSSYLNGCISKLAVYTIALTDTQLQAITA